MDSSVARHLRWGGRSLFARKGIVLMFQEKLRQEERLMIETFPAAYSEYRRRLEALIPGVF